MAWSMPRSALAGTFVSALLFVAPPAAAQQEGVFIDPGSPAGQEYALPLAQARDQATGRPSDRAPRTARDVPLFGEGVRPAFRRVPDGGAPPSGRGATRPAEPQRTAPPQRGGAVTTRLAAATSPGGSGTGWTLVVGLGVVAAGALLGLALGAATRRSS
jgi:hypothetical protein